MSTKRVASRPTTVTRIPLDRITITWERPARFIGEKGKRARVSITGAQLAPVLRYLSSYTPSGWWAGFTDPDALSVHLPELQHLALAIADADCDRAELQQAASGLAWMAQEIGDRMDAHGTTPEGMTVAIAAAPKAGA